MRRKKLTCQAITLRNRRLPAVDASKVPPALVIGPRQSARPFSFPVPPHPWTCPTRPSPDRPCPPRALMRWSRALREQRSHSTQCRKMTVQFPIYVMIVAARKRGLPALWVQPQKDLYAEPVRPPPVDPLAPSRRQKQCRKRPPPPALRIRTRGVHCPSGVCRAVRSVLPSAPLRCAGAFRGVSTHRR